MSNTNLSNALAALQEAQTVLEAEHAHIENHNIDVEAHPDIRELIDRIMDSEEVYSNTQIRAIINELLDAHKATGFKTAHPGWTAFETALSDQLAALTQRITTIEARLDAQASASTDLAARLAIVENKYAPILDSLTEQLTAAQNAGDTLLADSYKETIRLQLANKAQEELDVITAWQEEHS